MDSSSVPIATVRAFVAAAGLPPPRGVCALTVQFDYSSLAGSFIWDEDIGELLPHYTGYFAPRHRPLEPLYRRVHGVDWTINYVRDLAPAAADGQRRGAPDLTTANPHHPFCCGDLVAHGGVSVESVPRREHAAFKNKEGSVPGTVFHVVRKVQHGPLLDNLYLTLDGGVRVPADAPAEHCKNGHCLYLCNRHNLWALRSDTL